MEQYPQDAPSVKQAPDRTALRAALLLERFVNRPDLVYVLAEWGRPCTAIPIDVDRLVRSHLTGCRAAVVYQAKNKETKEDKTWKGREIPQLLGLPALSAEGLCKWTCLDFDGAGGDHKKPLENAFAAASEAFESARRWDLPAYLEKSKSTTGWHLWLFYETPIPAADARALGILIAPKTAPLVGGGIANDAKHKNVGIEVFPKQSAQTAGGKGNQVWAPFWHGAKPGGSCFYDPDGPAPLDLLEVECAPADALERALGEARRRFDATGKAKAPAGRAGRIRIEGDAAGWAEQEAIEIVSEFAKEGEGDRGRLFFVVACRLAGLVNGGHLAEVRARDLLWWACEQNGFAAKYPRSDFERRWGDAIGAAQPRQSALPWRYQEQLDRAAAKEAEDPKAKDLEEAAQEFFQEIAEGIGKPGIKIVGGTLGGGKTRAAIEAAAVYAREVGTVTILSPTHDLSRESLLAARAAGHPAQRTASAPSESGFVDAAGARICRLPLAHVEAEYSAGRSGPEICRRCHYREECTVKDGWEGDAGARLCFSSHASPADECAVIVDEKPELVREDSASSREFEVLAAGVPTIAERFAADFKGAGDAMLRWVKAKGGPNPIGPYRGALIEAATQKNGTLRALVPRRRIMCAPGSEEYEDTAQHDGPGWAAAAWLMRLILEEAEPSYTDKIRRGDTYTTGASFLRRTIAVQRIISRGGAVILDGTSTAADDAAYHILTGGLAVQRVEVRIKDSAQAPTVREWWPRAKMRRASVLDHGRPVWPEIAPHLAAVGADLEKHPEERSILLGSYKPVALGLSLAWQDHVGAPLEAEDLAAWRKLFSSKKAADASLKAAWDALGPILRVATSRRAALEFLWFGNLRGLNRFKAFDVAYALGDPFTGETPENKAAGLSTEKEESWRRNMDAAAAELSQFLGRMRSPSRTTPCRVVSLSYVLPADWRPSRITVVYTPKGRPPRAAPVGGGEAVAVLRRLAETYSVRRLAEVLGESKSSVDRYLRGAREPSPEVAAKILEIARVSTVPENVPVEPPSSPLVLNTFSGTVPKDRNDCFNLDAADTHPHHPEADEEGVGLDPAYALEPLPDGWSRDPSDGTLYDPDGAPYVGASAALAHQVARRWLSDQLGELDDAAIWRELSGASDEEWEAR